MSYIKPLTIIAAVMLFLAISPLWPYAYFQLLRIVICLVAIVDGYWSYQHKYVEWVWIMGIIAIVFNPIAPLYLPKELWVTIDMLAALAMAFFIPWLLKKN